MSDPEIVGFFTEPYRAFIESAACLTCHKGEVWSVEGPGALR